MAWKMQAPFDMEMFPFESKESVRSSTLFARRRFSTLLCRFASAAVLLAGLSGLAGWLTDIEILGRPSPWCSPMSFTTSIFLCLAALSIAINSLPKSLRLRRTLGILGMTMLVGGSIILAAYLTGGSLPSDTWLLDRRMAAGFPSPVNRMSPVSGACFALLGWAMFLSACRRRKSRTAVQSLSALGLLLALISLVGYLYSIATLVALGDYKPIAPQTAGAFVLLFVGVYLGSPGRGVMKIVLSEESGGILSRRLLLFVFTIPILLGALASEGLRIRLLSPATSIFFLTAATVVSLAGLLLFNAFTINRSERERRAARRSLEESECAYRTLFQSAADPMFLVDRSLTILEVNEAAALCLEVPVSELKGRSMPELTRLCATETRQRLELAFREGNGSFESCGRTPGGRDVPLEINARAVEFRGKTAVLTIARDLSERRRAERQLAEKEGLLRQGQKMEAIGRLAGGVAHDFNNLLTVIMGYTELLLTRRGVPEEARLDAAEVKTCAARAAALTRQLLAFSRQQPATPRNTDPNKVVQEIAPLLRRLIGENIQLDIHLPPSRSTIYIDPNQLEQVLLNLAVNARDSMPDGGTLTIENNERSIDSDSLSSAGARPGRLRRAHGPGLGMWNPAGNPATYLRAVFHHQAGGQGHGAGAVNRVRHCDAEHGLHPRRHLSQDGTAMRVLFPVACSAEAASPEGNETTADVSKRRSGTLLLVEDDHAVRVYLDAGLRRVGYRVLTAETGEEALRVVDNYRGTIDAVVSDVVMPGLSGQELAAALEQRIPGVRILFMSGYDQAGVPGTGALCGRYNLIAKPFAITELIDKLHDDRPASTALYEHD